MVGKGVRKPMTEAAQGEPWVALEHSVQCCLRAACAEWAFAKCWCIDLGQGYGSASLILLSRPETSPLPSLLFSLFLLSSFPFPVFPVKFSLAGSVAP